MLWIKKDTKIKSQAHVFAILLKFIYEPISIEHSIHSIYPTGFLLMLEVVKMNENWTALIRVNIELQRNKKKKKFHPFRCLISNKPSISLYQMHINAMRLRYTSEEWFSVLLMKIPNAKKSDQTIIEKKTQRTEILSKIFFASMTRGKILIITCLSKVTNKSSEFNEWWCLTEAKKSWFDRRRIWCINEINNQCIKHPCQISTVESKALLCSKQKNEMNEFKWHVQNFLVKHLWGYTSNIFSR